MSLSSLKRKSPAQGKKSVSVEQFIDGAQAYARGGEKVIDNVFDLPVVTLSTKDPTNKLRKSNATFSLSVEAKQTLDFWAVKTGISRSRLIRIWLDLLTESEIEDKYLKSKLE